MDSDVISILANGLSSLTILSCLFLKVPQILYIRKHKSAEGIYLQAMLMEIVGFSIVTLYNFTNNYSIITYLEYPIILIQVYVMLYYVLKYSGCIGAPIVPLTTVLYILTVAGFASAIFSKDILTYLVPICTPLSGFAKVTYIYGIIKVGNADAVSITTWIISVLTNVSRLFTVYVDSADIRLMINFIVSGILSSGVLLTALYYQLSKCGSNRVTGKRYVSRRSSHVD